VADSVKLVSKGMRELLRSDEVRQDLEKRAKRVAAAAGPGHESSSTIGRTRALAMVWTGTPEAMVAEATDRTLTRAVDAAR
jgi:hypothetical protein